MIKALKYGILIHLLKSFSSIEKNRMLRGYIVPKYSDFTKGLKEDENFKVLKEYIRWSQYQLKSIGDLNTIYLDSKFIKMDESLKQRNIGHTIINNII